jgi:uncharacterized protein
MGGGYIWFVALHLPHPLKEPAMLHEIWPNFTHNLFKPLLLFFYLGFLIPILKVRFEFPYVIYQGLTIYLLLAASAGSRTRPLIR